MNLFSRKNDNELCKYLEKNEYSRIDTIKEKVVIKSENYIIQEQDDERDIFVIQKGQVSVCYKGSDGTEKEIAKLHEKQVIGEINFIFPLGRTAYIKAIGSVELYRYPYQDLINLLKSDIKIAAKIFAALNDILAKKMIRTTQKMEGNIKAGFY